MPNSFERPYFSSSPPYSFGDIYLYRFSFNGKEKDNETYGNGNAYDFGARIYDCRLGRWFSVDPAYNKFPFCSPFTFALNKPIFYIDSDGREIYPTNQFKNSSYNNVLLQITSHIEQLPSFNKYLKNFINGGNQDMKLDFFNFANLYEPTKKNENFEYKRGHTLNLTNSNVSLVDFNALSTFMFSNNQDANGYVKGYELTEVGMVTIMVHEFIHANDIDSHDDMVSKRTDIKNAILEYSKSTEGRIIVDDKQAELLSWVGLEDTEEWESTFNTEDKKQTYFEQLTKSMYNTKETEMKSKDYDKLMNSTPEEKR